MHILFLTDNFPPEGNAPASRTFEHAVCWVEVGHKVTVITGAPNFPEGKVYDGYRNSWYSLTEIDGIQVIRVKTYITANEGFVKRIFDYMSFMVTGSFSGLFVKNVDVVVATSPQFFTAVGGWLVSVIRRKPFVFELRDIWPASITAVGAMKKTRLFSLLEKLEIFLYRKADLIISVTESFKEELANRGVDTEKIEVVRNGVNLSVYKPSTEKNPELSKNLGLEDKFVIGYIGTHGMAHALDKVLECAESLKDHPQIRFLFVGGGAFKSSLDETIHRKQLNNVISLPRQAKEDMPKVWSLVNVSLVSLRNVDLFQTVIPSKIFESMGMGIPMLFTGPVGEASEIIRRTGSGLIVAPENPVLLREAALIMYNSSDRFNALKKSSLEASREYDRKAMADKMLSVIALMLESKRLKKDV